jgi:hypothetical protein
MSINCACCDEYCAKLKFAGDIIFQCLRIYNILLPRNYKAWLQSSSSAEASKMEAYFEEERPISVCLSSHFRQVSVRGVEFHG